LVILQTIVEQGRDGVRTIVVDNKSQRSQNIRQPCSQI
jgi:hypothetical protein